MSASENDVDFFFFWKWGMSLPLSLSHSLKIRNTKVEKRLVKPSTLYLLHQQGVYIVISIHMAKLKISIRYQQ